MLHACSNNQHVKQENYRHNDEEPDEDSLDQFAVPNSFESPLKQRISVETPI